MYMPGRTSTGEGTWTAAVAIEVAAVEITRLGGKVTLGFLESTREGINGAALLSIRFAAEGEGETLLLLVLLILSLLLLKSFLSSSQALLTFVPGDADEMYDEIDFSSLRNDAASISACKAIVSATVLYFLISSSFACFRRTSSSSALCTFNFSTFRCASISALRIAA